jgi:putative heme-binding domain-containing protein
MSKDNSTDFEIPALIALTSVDVNAAASFMGEAVHEIKDPQSCRAVFRSFLQRHGGATALAKVFASKAPPPEIAAVAIQVMNETGRRDEELVRVLTPVETTRKLSLADVPQLVAEVRASGNAVRGEQVLKRPELGCLSCHAVKGQGGKIGPDLGALGTAQPIDFIVGAILDPQKEVKEGYMVTAVTTKDGDDFQGYAIREDGREIVLRDILQNSTVTIEKSRIAQKRQTGSPMPSGLADAMTRREFVDLVKYLSELGRQ